MSYSGQIRRLSITNAVFSFKCLARDKKCATVSWAVLRKRRPNPHGCQVPFLSKNLRRIYLLMYRPVGVDFQPLHIGTKIQTNFSRNPTCKQLNFEHFPEQRIDENRRLACCLCSTGGDTDARESFTCDRSKTQKDVVWY